MNYFYKKLLSLYHWLWAFAGNIFFGFPSKKIFVVGVTGTKGKSTTLDIMSAMIEASGQKTAVLNSVRRKVADKDEPNKYGNSMPGRFAVQQFLRDAVKAGCAYAFVEATSQGIVQHRHQFIAWDAAGFTNLHPEHIESHGSFEKYRSAKVSFFDYVGESSKSKHLFLINEDDSEQTYFTASAKKAKNSQIIFFSKKKFNEEFHAVKLSDWLSVDFNRENCACAVAFARAMDISGEVIKKVLETFVGIAGRMEFVQQSPFAVVVDYAHTPESLEAIYKALKPKEGRLIGVFGSDGGGRDKWKRPILGKVAGEYCDVIILTEENPHDEDPVRIVSEIRAGISKSEFLISNDKIYEIVDRREAIKKAISIAEEGDVVVMTGKGSEPWLYLPKGKRIPWSDSKISKEILNGN